MRPEIAPLKLLQGHTIHQRSVPFRHRFRYGLNLIEIDIDRLDEAHRQSGLFSVGSSNLFSFRSEDHGARGKASLREWADARLAEAGVRIPEGSVRLITFARHAFYKFAPISIWMAYDSDGALKGVIYEVNNTFGETHTYVAAIPGEEDVHRHTADKVFHVSPFFDISGRYGFRLRHDATRFQLIVETRSESGQSHVATIQARYRPATSPAFALLAVRKPLSSLAVSLAIHWQALKIWLKGARYHKRPKTPSNEVTVALKEVTRPTGEAAG